MKCKYQHCNEEFIGRSDQLFCSLTCNRSYHTIKRRHDNKRKAVEYKGGSCERCGYKKSLRALTFHHLDPSQKDFQISNNNNMRSWEKIRVELDKCIMLCANCHAEEHDNQCCG